MRLHRPGVSLCQGGLAWTFGLVSLLGLLGLQLFISEAEAAALTPQFSSAARFPAGSNATFVGVFDLNNDRKPDLVVANANSDIVTVLIGTIDKERFAVSNYHVGFGPRTIAAGDLNNDGKIDLLIARQSTNAGNVLLGLGNGTFQAGTDYPADSAIASVALTDLNGDGALDLATANNVSNTVSIQLGNGGGLFTNVNDYPVGQSPVSLVLADFNRDTLWDLAVVNQQDNQVSVLLGIGGAALGLATNFNTGAGPAQVVAGDLDNDGKIDLVTANANAASVTILLGSGNGSFVAGGTYSVGSNPVSLVLGDFNGDGNLDVITANDTAPPSLTVLSGLGGGTMGQRVDLPAGLAARWVGTGDFNRDWRPDIVIAEGNAGTVAIHGNETLPKLEIRNLTNTHQLSWFSWRAQGLQANTDLLLQEGWDFLSELPEQAGNRQLLVRPNTNGGGFYRLKTRGPPMGFNSWFSYGTLISEAIVKSIADGLVTNGYARLGYRYVNLDDGWASKERDANGDIIAYTNKFTAGSLQAAADYVHQRGLLFGVYTETGPQTYTSAGTGLTSWEHFDRDAAKYAEWKVDYVKCDGPGGIAITDPAFRQLRESFAAALRATGRPMFINTSVNPLQPWMIDSHHSIRQLQYGDVVLYSILINWLDEIWRHKEEYGPGFWPDLDAMSWHFFTEQEHRTQFTMSCMISGLLLLDRVPGRYGGKYCTNASLIAIDQDPAGIVADKTWSNSLAEIWSKPLGSRDSSTRAVALMNRSSGPQSITMYWTNIGLASGVATVKDLTSQSIIGYHTNQFTTNVLGHSVEAYLLTPGIVPVLPHGTNYLGNLFWGPIATHTPERVIGKNFVPYEPFVNSGGPIQLRGIVYPTGLSFSCETFPNSVSYFLGKQVSSFQTTIGHDDYTMNVASGSISVRFYADATKIFDRAFTPSSMPLSTNFNLSDVNVLTIQVVTNAPPGNGFLDLANALFVVP